MPALETGDNNAPVSRIFWGAGWFLAGLAAYARSFLGVFSDAASNLPRLAREPARSVLLKQIYFTGIEAMPLLALLAVVVGFASLSPLYRAVLNDMDNTISVFRILVLQEAAPLLVGFFLLARSGSAIATELANNRHQGELGNLYRMGIEAGHYLVAPRVAATALSMSALTVYFQIFLVLGGFALMSVFSGWDFTLALAKFAGSIEPFDAVMTVVKALIFGVLIGIISCQQGLSAARGPLGIPVAARTAAVHGFAAIIIAEGISVFVFGQ